MEREKFLAAYEEVVALIREHQEGHNMLAGGNYIDHQVAAHIMNVMAETRAGPLLATEAIILGIRRGDLKAAVELAKEELGADVDREVLREFVLDLIGVREN